MHSWREIKIPAKDMAARMVTAAKLRLSDTLVDHVVDDSGLGPRLSLLDGATVRTFKRKGGLRSGLNRIYMDLSHRL